MEIIKATAGDIPALMELYRKLYAHLKSLGSPFELDETELHKLLETAVSSRLCCVAAAVDSRGKSIEGFILLLINRIDRKLKRGETKHTGVVSDIFMNPDFRGKGAAELLLAYGENWLRENGVSLVECHVITGNERSEKFFAKHGYVPRSRQFGKIL